MFTIVLYIISDTSINTTKVKILNKKYLKIIIKENQSYIEPEASVKSFPVFNIQ